MSKTIVKKWMCGQRWGGDPYAVVQAEFVETAKQYRLLDTPENHAITRSTLGYIGVQFSKDDKRLHDTREAAINQAITEATHERDRLLSKLVKKKMDIEQLEKLLNA